MTPSRTGPAAARAGLLALGVALRLALVALPLLLLRAALSPRRRLSDLGDRELADIGLTRAEVERMEGGPGAVEREMRRTLQGQNWR